MKPLILIVPSSDEKKLLKINESYINAVCQKGGIPIISAYYNNECTDEILQNIQGIIFSGGVDPNPIFFGENPMYCNEVSPKRDIFEINLCRKAFKKNIPMLGICRGMQIIALAFGGKIYQDIQKEHFNTFNHFQNFSGKYPFHGVNIIKNTGLYSILQKKRIYVNSFHHQAVCEVPKNFIISAKSDDLIIEAIEYTGKNFIMGVQWHPEQTSQKSIRRYIFKTFIDKAKRS